jgi:Na+-translocating ferredoxin:NAD+ oxidoreductase RnfG subunit
MYHRVFSAATPAVVPAVLTALLTAYGCSTANSAGTSSRRVIEELFPGPVVLKPIQLRGSSQEFTKGTLVRIADVSDVTLGYAAELQVVSRSGPFPILVVLDPEQCVREVRVLRYTARRGRGVLSKPFASQFQGKCRGGPIQIGVDIDAVSGATLSSQAVAGGVRRVIDLAAGSAPD